MSVSILKSTVFVFVAIAFIGSLTWLWQRQPKPPEFVEEATSGAVSGQQITLDNLTLKIADNTIVNSKKIKLEGITFTNELVAIYSNNFQDVLKSDKDGNFETAVTLNEGLNLLTIAIVTDDKEKQRQKSLTFYFAKDKTDATIIFAGSVKNIFDTLVTVTTLSGEKNIRTSKSTEFRIPDEEEQQSTESAVKNVRIGDYAIGLGNAPENSKDTDTIIARSLEIIRENKPQNRINIARIKIISPVRQSIFSASVTSDVTTNTLDKKVMELTLDKNSDVTLNNKQGKTTDITKDKNAIVFYHTEGNKNLIDLVYLLP